MKGIETSIYHQIPQFRSGPKKPRGTYKDNVKRPITLHARLERVDSKRSILRNLDRMPILLQYLHCELLVHQVIFREQNVEYHVVRRSRRTDGARLESRDERRCEVLCAHGRRHFRADAIIQAPFDWRQSGSALRMIRIGGVATYGLIVEVSGKRKGTDVNDLMIMIRLEGATRRTGANNTIGMYRRCSYSRIVSVCRSVRRFIPEMKTKTYHAERVDDDGVDMWACRLVRDLQGVMYDIWAEAELLYAVYDARVVEKRVNEEDIAIPEWRHLREHRLHRQLPDLGRDGEEKLAPLADLALDPHASRH
jgi:hypothetical protein